MRINDPNRRLVKVETKREIVNALWAMPAVRLQVRLISAAVRAKKGPYAYFQDRVEQALESVSTEQILDDRFVSPTADRYIKKRNVYFRKIHRELDALIEAELMRRGLDWTGADIAELHILLTNREIDSNRTRGVNAS